MGREGARKGKRFIAISMLPDVCNTPIGSTMVPVPYTVTANLDESIGVSGNVFFGGAPAFTLNKSTVPRVRGDEAGTGRGVKSGGHLGKVEPIEGNWKVLVNRRPVVRHGDRCKMNDGNTIGKIYCTDAARPGCGIHNGKPTGDTNPPFFNGTSAGATSSAESNVLHQGKGVAIGAKDAVVDMAQGAWDMAKGAGRLLNPETAATQAEEIRKTVSGIAHDPKSLWEAIIQPYAEAISNGEYGNALGRGLVDVGTLFIGGIGGAGKAGEAVGVSIKSGKAARAAAGTGDAARTGLVKGLRTADDGVVISGRAESAKKLAKGDGTRFPSKTSKWEVGIPLTREQAKMYYMEFGWSEAKVESHLNGIDFSKPVYIEKIPKGTILDQWVDPRRGPGNYFTERGTPATKLGIYQGERSRTAFVATEDVYALKSVAAPITDTWSVPGSYFPTKGGGVQYFVKNIGAFARYEVSHDVR